MPECHPELIKYRPATAVILWAPEAVSIFGIQSPRKVNIGLLDFLKNFVFMGSTILVSS